MPKQKPPKPIKPVKPQNTFTDIQKDVITGNLLGDGSIPYKKSGNHRFVFGQKEENKQYVELIKTILHPLTTQYFGKTSKLMNDKIFYAYNIKSISDPLFSNLRNQWYMPSDQPYAQKIIPKDIQLNWRILSYWYLDDGCNSQTAKTIYLNSQSFPKEDNEFLLSKLYSNLSIKATLNKVQCKFNMGYKIRIKAESYFDFIDGVKPYIDHLACFAYKTDTSKVLKLPKSDFIYDEKTVKLGLDLWQSGNYTQEAICKTIGCARETLKRWIRKNP